MLYNCKSCHAIMFSIFSYNFTTDKSLNYLMSRFLNEKILLAIAIVNSSTVIKIEDRIRSFI